MTPLIGIGLYSIPEASVLTGIKPQKIRRWMYGYESGNRVHQPPLWHSPVVDAAEETIGFQDLLEIRFVNVFRDYGVPMPALRAAAEAAREYFDQPYPFTCKRFQTDGRSVFAQVTEEAGEEGLVDLVKKQNVFNKIIKPSLYTGIEYDSDDDRFDGLSGTVNDIPVVVVGSQWSGDRQRFTLAHELGHLMLDNRLSVSIDEEKACNRFAGAFLAPAHSIRQLIGHRRNKLELRGLLFLKREYGVSMVAGAYRCSGLGIISDAQKKYLFIRINKKGWKKAEPEPLPSEQATLFKLLVYRALGEEFIGESKAAELMGMPVSRFHEYRMMEDMDAAVSHQ